jgi:hypothetical protein
MRLKRTVLNDSRSENYFVSSVFRAAMLPRKPDLK